MQVHDRPAALPGATFKEGYVEADGFRIRYVEAGTGPPVVCMHGAGGVRLSRAHDLLSEQYRVMVFEAPGFGESPVNERSQTMDDLAHSMNLAVAGLGPGRYNLMGTSFGGRLALCMALDSQENLEALVLVSPAAIRPEGHIRPAGAGERVPNLLFAHPERQPPLPPLSPEVVDKQNALVMRLRGPNRDQQLEARFAELQIPVLVLFGTEDQMIPSTVGHIYREKIPNCNLVLVYDAGHAIDGDRPEAFTAVVSDFLERHEAFVVNNQSSLLNP